MTGFLINGEGEHLSARLVGPLVPFHFGKGSYATATTGGWIVMQRNKKDSLVNFNKNWTDYKKGFGDLNTEFWYGLESMHCLTQRGHWEMRIDYQKNDKTWSYLHYNQFSVGSASKKYPLTVAWRIDRLVPIMLLKLPVRLWSNTPEFPILCSTNSTCIFFP